MSTNTTPIYLPGRFTLLESWTAGPTYLAPGKVGGGGGLRNALSLYSQGDSTFSCRIPTGIERLFLVYSTLLSYARRILSFFPEPWFEL